MMPEDASVVVLLQKSLTPYSSVGGQDTVDWLRASILAQGG